MKDTMMEIILPALAIAVPTIAIWRTHVANDKKFNRISGSISKIQGNISRIQVALSTMIGYFSSSPSPDSKGLGEAIHASQYVSDNSSDNACVESASPHTLTAKGAALAKKMNARDIVDKYRRHILLPDDAHKLAIQEGCMIFAQNSLMELINHDEKNKILDEIYEEGGNAVNILNIFAVLFRDAFFKERGIPVPEYIKS